jgi:Aminoglycoside-2''-adenylyltransferase
VPDIPAPVTRVAEIMATFPGEWCLCGGWAVDAWVGRQTREHKDVDLLVFEEDLPALLSHFAGWELLAHDTVDPDSTQQWNGRSLTLPAHVHARTAGVDLDFQVSQREAEHLVLCRAPRIQIDLQRAVAAFIWGLPTLAPEVLLYYKALERRAQDDLDFAVLEPQLSDAQASWLRDALFSTQAG